MKSRIYQFIENFFHEDIIQIAENMNYSEANILILKGEEEVLGQRYPEILENLKSCNHHRDKRSSMEYAQDLICSWIFEDYFLKNLKNKGIKVDLSGEDKKREILNNIRISASSDYVIQLNDRKAYIELVNDYTGYWNKTKKCDLRDDKFTKIKNKATQDTVSLLLGIDFQNRKFFVMNANDNVNVMFISSHFPYGGKPAYSIDLNKIGFYDFNFEIIKKKIGELIF